MLIRLTEGVMESLRMSYLIISVEKIENEA